MCCRLIFHAAIVRPAASLRSPRSNLPNLCFSLLQTGSFFHTGIEYGQKIADFIKNDGRNVCGRTEYLNAGGCDGAL
jgi:hypothetical protein